MKIITEQITQQDIKEMAEKMFGNYVKAVVDISQGIIAIDAELHADLEALLLEQGSKREDVWGINFYPDLPGDQFIEFDSMVNIKPSLGNRSRGIDDPVVKEKIISVVNKLVK